MKGYLQRLFDRGAGLTSAAPTVASADVASAMAPRSPTVAFDQRLAEPGWAQAFGALRGSPAADTSDFASVADAGALLEATEEEAQAPATQPLSAPAAIVPVARRSVSRAEPVSEPVVRESSAIDRDVRPAAFAGSPPDPTTTTEAALTELPAPTLPAVVSRIETLSPQPTPAEPRIRDAAQRTGPRETQQFAAPQRAHSEPLDPIPVMPLAHPDLTDRATAAGPRRAVEPTVRADPAPVLRTQAPQVEPLRPAPAPLAALPAAAPDPQELRRMVREAVRAELASRPAASNLPADGRRDRSRARDTAAASRPASAREASVIGELEPSGSALTLYGLRRR